MEAIAKFAADRMLARVARWLRTLGADTIFDESIDGTTLLKIAPGLVHPLQFLLPCYHATDRWFYGAGLALYDVLGADKLMGVYTGVALNTA